MGGRAASGGRGSSLLWLCPTGPGRWGHGGPARWWPPQEPLHGVPVAGEVIFPGHVLAGPERGWGGLQPSTRSSYRPEGKVSVPCAGGRVDRSPGSPHQPAGQSPPPAPKGGQAGKRQKGTVEGGCVSLPSARGSGRSPSAQPHACGSGHCSCCHPRLSRSLPSQGLPTSPLHLPHTLARLDTPTPTPRVPQATTTPQHWSRPAHTSMVIGARTPVERLVGGHPEGRALHLCWPWGLGSMDGVSLKLPPGGNTGPRASVSPPLTRSHPLLLGPPRHAG